MPSNGSSNALSWATASPPQSKFRIHSDKMTETLQQFEKYGGSPLHSYQIGAVLRTKGVIMADESERLREPDIEHDTTPVLIVAPTGSGKSGMIVLLPYVLNSEKVLILTPSKVISEQLSIAFGHRRDRPCFFEKIGLVPSDPVEKKKTLESLLEEVRVIQSPNDIKERLGNVVVVNAQKFGGRSKLSLVYKNEDIIGDVEAFFQEFDTLIVDEAHHYPAKTWEKIVEEFSKPVEGLVKKIVFLTATPYKNIGGKEVFILGEGAQRRIAYQITPETVEGISTRRCEFREPKHDAQQEHVLKDILKIFKENMVLEERITNPQAMILVRLKNDAEKLADFMNAEMGEPDFAVEITPKNPEALEKFTNGDHRVAITCGVAKEGYDNPNVICCVVLRKIVKGRILFHQFVGRCRRLNRRLEGDGVDRTVGIVLSYPEYQQQLMWDDMEKLANDDPLEIDEPED